MTLPHRQLLISDIVAQHAVSRPADIAVVDHDVRLSYRQLHDETIRLAAGLAARGVRAGDRILWLGQNSYRLLEAIIAASSIGASVCPANWRQSSEEIAFIIDDIEPALVLYQNDLESVTSRANKDEANGRYLDYESDDFMQLLTGDAAPPRPSVSLDDPLILMYTAAFSGLGSLWSGMVAFGFFMASQIRPPATVVTTATTPGGGATDRQIRP